VNTDIKVMEGIQKVDCNELEKEANDYFNMYFPKNDINYNVTRNCLIQIFIEGYLKGFNRS